MRPCRQYAAGNATCHEKRSTSVAQGSDPPTFFPAIPPLCLASRGWRAPSLPAFASISLGTKLGAPRPSHVESPTFRWNLRRRRLPRPVSVRRSRYYLDSRSRGRRRACSTRRASVKVRIPFTRNSRDRLRDGVAGIGLTHSPRRRTPHTRQINVESHVHIRRAPPPESMVFAPGCPIALNRYWRGPSSRED